MRRFVVKRQSGIRLTGDKHAGEHETAGHRQPLVRMFPFIPAGKNPPELTAAAFR